jgi:hypothetical protein
VKGTAVCFTLTPIPDVKNCLSKNSASGFVSTIMFRLKFCFNVRARERACSGVRFPCQRELLGLHILETAGGEGFGNGVTCSVVAGGERGKERSSL